MRNGRQLILILASLIVSGSGQATSLITASEAKLPPPTGAVALDRRGIMRAPKVEAVSPNGAIQSPFRLSLKFDPHGGTAIDLDSVKVTFLRTPNVDLTSRVRPFLRQDGIDMPAAEAPPGDFVVRVDVKDSEGHLGVTTFTLKVSP
jgi:hypothetical protein